MVKDSGAALRTHRLRPLAAPQPLCVETDDCGRPVSVAIEGDVRMVASVQDRWRIDDEWWREPAVSRMYYRLQLEGDRVVTVYQDLGEGAWWLQRY